MRRLAARALSFSRAKWMMSAGLILLAAPLVAGPVLHERFEAKPSEDIRLGATTASGAMPVALQTRSGLISAPNETEKREHDRASPSYGGARTQASADASYYIDRVTSRPDRVKYDEPFRPSILPFKRTYAFDLVRSDLSLGVSDESLSRVSVGGLVDRSEDAFYADFDVDLVANLPVRIPVVGPGARVRALHTDPPISVEILEDGAQNWFARSERTGRVRMVMQVSISRQVFGSQFRNVSWSALSPFVSALPDAVPPVAREVLDRIGVPSMASPAGVLLTLVQYFRRFQESNELPASTEAIELYRELSFSQKGVCRHRAYAFLVTALAAGLPTRLVHNEAHAWVEVFDTEIWHRIDLGGAAMNIHEPAPDPLLPSHRPPADPHSWPHQSRPATESTPRAFQPSLASEPDPKRETKTEQLAQGSPANGSNVSGLALGPGANESSEDVRLRLLQKRLLRGQPLSVSGSASRGGRPCPLSRVDIFIAPGEQNWRAIGSVATDRSGEFTGDVTLPQITPVGPLQVTARLSEGSCGK